MEPKIIDSTKKRMFFCNKIVIIIIIIRICHCHLEWKSASQCRIQMSQQHKVHNWKEGKPKSLNTSKGCLFNLNVSIIDKILYLVSGKIIKFISIIQYFFPLFAIMVLSINLWLLICSSLCFLFISPRGKQVIMKLDFQ